MRSRNRFSFIACFGRNMTTVHRSWSYRCACVMGDFRLIYCFLTVILSDKTLFLQNLNLKYYIACTYRHGVSPLPNRRQKLPSTPDSMPPDRIRDSHRTYEVSYRRRTMSNKIMSITQMQYLFNCMLIKSPLLTE